MPVKNERQWRDDVLRRLERLADQKTYTRIMNMNNTVLSISLEASAE